MKYRIYLDAFFLINFYMDYIILLAVSKVLKTTSTHLYLRRMLGAAVGAIYVCLLLVLRLDGWYIKITSYAGIVMLMSFILNGKRSIRQLAKCAVYIYLCACTLGGIMHVLYYYTFVGYFIYDSGGTTLTVVITAIVLEPVLHKAADKSRKELLYGNVKMAAVLENGGKKVKMTALIDTGNSLYDPFFGEPVNIVESRCIKKMNAGMFDSSYHLIPFSSLGNDNGLIPVVRIEQITVITQKGKISLDAPLIALYSGRLSGKGAYNMILHPEILQTENLEMGDKECI